MVNRDGSALTRLTEHPESDFSPTWSPDGKRVLFSSRRRGDADLFVLDLETSEITQLTRSKRDEYDPAWSPDGQWIAFAVQIERQSDVCVMPASGGEAVNLTESPYANDFQPTWTQDSQQLYFVSYTMAEGDHEIYVMQRDGSDVRQVSDDDQDDLAPCVRPSATARP
jgi:TolB protein